MSVTLQRCETCGALVDAEDLFCANCGTEVSGNRPEAPARVATAAKNFACKSCGATMNYDAAAQSLKCPFCGSVDLEEDKTQGLLAPEFVIPFAIDRDEAERRLRGWLGSSFWHPNDLRNAAQARRPAAGASSPSGSSRRGPGPTGRPTRAGRRPGPRRAGFRCMAVGSGIMTTSGSPPAGRSTRTSSNALLPVRPRSRRSSPTRSTSWT